MTMLAFSQLNLQTAQSHWWLATCCWPTSLQIKHTQGQHNKYGNCFWLQLMHS